MSAAAKILAGLCICPVVAAPPALLHKPTRDKIARAAGYVPAKKAPASASKKPAGLAQAPECPPVMAAPAPLASIGLTPLGLSPEPITELTSASPFLLGPGAGPGGGFLVPPGGGGGGGINPPPPPPPVSGIPEPTTWMTMMIGFGAIGGAARWQGGATKKPA